jgi:hypothetical protein
MFFRCSSFEEYRKAAFKVSKSDMDFFERMFISGPDGPDGVMERTKTPDGTWPPLDAYIEIDFFDPPDAYPVIVYGKYTEEQDRFGVVEMFSWDWVDSKSLEE